jgi:hypothetical protein
MVQLSIAEYQYEPKIRCVVPPRSRLRSRLTPVTLGKLEMTMMKSACQAANLPSLLHDEHVHSIVSELTEVYGKFVNEDQRGTRIHDALSFQARTQGVGDAGKSSKETTLDNSVYHALLSRLNVDLSAKIYVPRPHKTEGQYFLSKDAIQCKGVQVGGVRYQPITTSSGNSNIMFRIPGSSKQVAGQISQIFLHTHKEARGKKVQETFLVAHPFAPLSSSDALKDNYRKFHLVGGFLHYAHYEGKLMYILRPTDIICHIAKTTMCNLPGITQKCFHILPLDRVCFI